IVYGELALWRQRSTTSSVAPISLYLLSSPTASAKLYHLLLHHTQIDILQVCHVARRIARIEKEFLYLPYGDDFQERLAAHWANLNRMKWMLWNDGVEMAEFGMTRVRIGLFQHALAHPEANGERFEGIEAKLDEL